MTVAYLAKSPIHAIADRLMHQLPRSTGLVFITLTLMNSLHWPVSLDEWGPIWRLYNSPISARSQQFGFWRSFIREKLWCDIFILTMCIIFIIEPRRRPFYVFIKEVYIYNWIIGYIVELYTKVSLIRATPFEWGIILLQWKLRGEIGPLYLRDWMYSI